MIDPTVQVVDRVAMLRLGHLITAIMGRTLIYTDVFGAYMKRYQ